MTATQDAFFVQPGPDAGDRRFCLLHRPDAGSVRGSVLHVHAFAEEMNKARRMVSLQSRALAAAGFAVLQIDLLGCGDSSGDFADASWDRWTSDVVCASRWLRDRFTAPLWLWGLRAGCLLAAQAADRLDEAPRGFVFWQPTPSGRAVLQQFLRLKLAALMGSGQTPGSIESLREALLAGRTVEVAGYHLAPALASGLEGSVLNPARRPSRMAWLEVGSRQPPALLPASGGVLNHWRQAGFEVHEEAIHGVAFWQTTEIEVVPALHESTTRWLEAQPA